MVWGSIPGFAILIIIGLAMQYLIQDKDSKSKRPLKLLFIIITSIFCLCLLLFGIFMLWMELTWS